MEEFGRFCVFKERNNLQNLYVRLNNEINQEEDMMKQSKKMSIGILMFLLLVVMMKSKIVDAATFSDLNSDVMFFKQNTTSTCTLSSSAMMIRRAALLNGNENWADVTENNLYSTAWLSGVGLYNSFSYAGINITSAQIASDKEQVMINLLLQHPEGIVIYDYEKPHAILLTDYTDGVFYCADPSSAAPNGRIPISQATIAVESMDKYWYVSSPKLDLNVGEKWLAEGCLFDEASGKLTITQDFKWRDWDQWRNIKDLKFEKVITAEIDLTGTEFLSKRGEYYDDDCWITFNDFTNLEEICFSGSINTELEVSLSYLFSNCSKLSKVDLTGFSGANVVDAAGMFQNCSSLRSLDLSKINTSNVKDMHGMFEGCSLLEKLDLSQLDTAKVVRMGSMFGECSSLESINVSGFDTAQVVDMGAMFEGCSSLKKLDVSTFDTSNVFDMVNMFRECTALVSLNIGSLDVSKVTSMFSMFEKCKSLKKLDLSRFKTRDVVEMNQMFLKCSALEELDVSGFDTSKVTNMENMFCGCSSLKKLDVSGFDTSNVTDMTYMFLGCSSLEKLDVSGFNTSKVESMGMMFHHCDNLQKLDVSNFNTSNVTSIAIMFSYCDSLKEIDFSNFDCGKITNDGGNTVIEKMNSVEVVKVPANLPYSIKIPVSYTIPNNMEAYWVDTSGTECSEIRAGLAVPMTYTRKMRPIMAAPPVTQPDSQKPGTQKPGTQQNQQTGTQKPVPLAKGKSFTDSKTKYKYKVTGSSASKPTIAFSGTAKKSKKVTIPSSVKYQGITYQVTSVSAKALKGNTKVTSLVVGANVMKIEKNAFDGCKNLKSIQVKTKKLKSVGKNVFKGIHKKCKIKVPATKVKAYKKLFKKKGQKPTVKISK